MPHKQDYTGTMWNINYYSFHMTKLDKAETFEETQISNDM